MFGRYKPKQVAQAAQQLAELCLPPNGCQGCGGATPATGSFGVQLCRMCLKQCHKHCSAIGKRLSSSALGLET